MKIIEERRETPVLLECEVLVVGGGPAGIAAAVGAARAGAQTVIAERFSCLGGNITVSAVEPPSWYRQEHTAVPGGVASEIEARMIARGAVSPTFFRPSTGYAYDTEIFKQMADDYMADCGVTPVYHCLGTVPYLADGEVRGVITESKSGRQAILARRVVDCTGDADIAARAGAPYELRNGASTLKFFMRDVDLEKLAASTDSDPLSRDPLVHKLFYQTFKKAIDAGEAPLPDSLNLMHYTPTPPCDINVNLACMDFHVDATDVLSLTAGEIRGRKTALKVIDRLNRYGEEDGFGHSKLRSYAMAIGIRESRRITASYVLSGADVLHKARFDDTIGIFPVYMDGMGVKVIPYTDDYYQVPFRILVPQGVENLLCAGRCISCTRDAVPSTRQMDFCMVTGQAAGAASALSLKQGVSSARVNISSLQEELQRQGLRVF